MIGLYEYSTLGEALLLALALSLDAFAASFAYGSKQIKIPFASVCVIDLVCGLIVGVSLLAGTVTKGFIPEAVSFWILFLLGAEKLADGIVKSLIRRYGGVRRDLNFSLCSIRFVLSLYADPEKADRDSSQSIAPGEAASLAVALSLDGIAVGFGAAVGQVNAPAVFCFSLLANALAVFSGAGLGNRLSRRLPFSISWLGGVILIVMAVLRLF